MQLLAMMYIIGLVHVEGSQMPGSRSQIYMSTMFACVNSFMAVTSGCKVNANGL